MVIETNMKQKYLLLSKVFIWNIFVACFVNENLIYLVEATAALRRKTAQQFNLY